MAAKMGENIFYTTEADASDFDSFEQFRLVDEDQGSPYVLGETVLPNATRSGASIVRNTRFWEADDFARGQAPTEAKEAFAELTKETDAHRT